jgi:hypothetical protein
VLLFLHNSSVSINVRVVLLCTARYYQQQPLHTRMQQSPEGNQADNH